MVCGKLPFTTPHSENRRQRLLKQLQYGLGPIQEKEMARLSEGRARRLLDPHRAITKQLKFYAETSHPRGPLHFAGKVTSESGKNSATNIGQIPIHLFILETWKRSRNGCVIKKSLWPIRTAITAVTRMKPEWLSLQSLPVSSLAQLSVRLRDHWRLGPVWRDMHWKNRQICTEN